MSGLTKFVHGWTKCCKSKINFFCLSVMHSHGNECFVNFFSVNERSIRFKKARFYNDWPGAQHCQSCFFAAV